MVVGDSVRELCLFWNLRALRESTRFRGDDFRRVLLLPTRLINQEALRRLADTIRSAPSSGVNSNLDLAIYWVGRDGVDAWAKTARRMREFARIRGRIRISRNFGGPQSPPTAADDRRSLTYGYLVAGVPNNFYEGVHYEIPRPVPLMLGDNEVRLEPPPHYRNRFHQLVMLDFESDAWDRYPRRTEVARAIHQNARFTRYGVSFLASVPHQPTEFQFRLPSEWETLVAVFQRAGFEIRESQQTRYLEAVVQLLGGFNNVALLASRPALLLLQALAVPPTTRLAQRIVSQLSLGSLPEQDVARALRDAEVPVEISAASNSFQQLRDGRLTGYRSELLDLLSGFQQLEWSDEASDCRAPRVG